VLQNSSAADGSCKCLLPEPLSKKHPGRSVALLKHLPYIITHPDTSLPLNQTHLQVPFCLPPVFCLVFSMIITFKLVDVVLWMQKYSEKGCEFDVFGKSWFYFFKVSQECEIFDIKLP
jgi:hypothetical protein